MTGSAAFGQVVLAPMLPAFHAAYPEIDLDLVLTDDMLDLVAERMDLAFRLGRRPQGDMVAAKLLATQKRVVASVAYLDLHPPILDPADLAGHACLTFPFDGYRDSWLFRDARGRETAVPVTGRICTSNAMVLRDCAAAGLGLSLLADWLVDPDVAAGRLVHVLPDWTAAARAFDTGVWAAYPSRSFLPLKARVFIDHVRARIATTDQTRV